MTNDGYAMELSNLIRDPSATGGRLHLYPNIYKEYMKNTGSDLYLDTPVDLMDSKTIKR